MNNQENTLQIIVPNPKTASQIPTGNQYEVVINPEHSGSEIFMRIDSSDFHEVVNIVTKLFPEQSFCFLDEIQLFEQAKLFLANFLPNDPRQTIAYAIKANPKKRILEILHQAGITSFDCSSPGEIKKTLSTYPSSTAIYTHPFKFKKEIQYALQKGVRYFTVQTKDEILKILKVAKEEGISEEEIELAVRVKFLNKDAAMDLSQKYGTSRKQAKELLKFIKENSKASPAISTNTGSQNRNPSSYARALDLIIQTAKSIDQVSSINLGGGFPVNYHEEDRYDIKKILQNISNLVQEKCQNLLTSKNPRIIIEPGRAMTANTTDLIIPIRGIEDEKVRVVHIDDGVFTCFIDSSLHGWQYRFQKYGESKTSNTIPCIIFGRTCDNSDIIKGTIDLLANLTKDDYLIVKNAGAYFNCVATNREGFEPPKYIGYNLIGEDGE